MSPKERMVCNDLYDNLGAVSLTYLMRRLNCTLEHASRLKMIWESEYKDLKELIQRQEVS